MTPENLIDKAKLIKQLKVPAEQTADLADVIDAVIDLVADWVPAARWERPRTRRGAHMLAARLWRRRSSPSGVETLGELGPTYIAKWDPDIESLLGIGRHRDPIAL